MGSWVRKVDSNGKMAFKWEVAQHKSLFNNKENVVQSSEKVIQELPNHNDAEHHNLKGSDHSDIDVSGEHHDNS